MLDLLAPDLTALGHQHGPDILAPTLRAMQLGDQVHRQSALPPAELAGNALKIDLLIESTFEAEGMDSKARIHDGAERRMSCGIEFLGQSCALYGFT